MPIDPRIALGYQPTQVDSPINQLSQVMQVRDMQQNQLMNKLKVDEYQRNVSDTNALRAALSQPDADPYRVLIGHGRVKEAGEFAKSQNEAKKFDLDSRKTELEMGLKRAEHVSSVLSLAKDPNSYAQVRQVIAQSYGQQLPEQFDPVFIQAKVAEGQTITQKLAAEHQQLTMAETGRHNKSTEANTVRGQDLQAATSMRGQNMADSRAKEGNDIQRQAARSVVVETPDGPVLADKGTAQGRPITVNGKPVAGKPSAATEKELVGIRQQNAIVDGAIAAVDKTPDAFSLTRGMATMAGAIPESLAGRLDNDDQRQARSYVFNNVSKVINERAGAAQSAQELARLRSFLPAETDNAEQIKSKLQAFKKYLGDMDSGTRGTKPGGATGTWNIQRIS